MRAHVLLHHGFGAIRYHRSAQLVGIAFSLTLQNAENNRLASSAAALQILAATVVLVHVARFAADEGFVNFDFAASFPPVSSSCMASRIL